MIIKKGLILSSKKTTKNRIIGCVMPEDYSVLETMFNNYIRDVTKEAREKGDYIFQESVQDALVENREHLVYYAKALEPGINLCFIVAAYNVPTCTKAKMINYDDEIITKLYRSDFLVTVTTADNAAANEGTKKPFLSKKAKDFLDKDWLSKKGLDGDFLIAMTHPVTLTLIFCISDPPHCLKTLAGAVRGRDLQYDGCNMKGEMLCHVWQAIKLANGEFSIAANRKFKESDFIDTHDYDAMNVSSAARLFSGTMKKMLDNVIEPPKKYPIANVPPSVDEKKFYSKSYEMITEIDTIWDVMNGKDGNNMFVRFDKKNGEHYAKIFLNTSKFFNDWYTFLKSQQEDGKFDSKNFITMETFRSLKYICYGFASNE